MKNFNEHDKRQLKLMNESLIAFEKKQIGLGVLISNLEFLLSALEFVNEELEETFLKEITILETINALIIIKEQEEHIEINETKNKNTINQSIIKLKKTIETSLHPIRKDTESNLVDGSSRRNE